MSDRPTHPPISRPPHPLRAWRETQRFFDEKRQLYRPMTIADVARALGESYHTCKGWERYPGEPGARIPTRSNMEKLVALTRGEVRPDHFYDLPTLRAGRRGAVADQAA